MRVVVVTPAPPGSVKGNRVTAERWAGFLGELGHEVVIVERFDGESADVMIALHAGRSAASVARWSGPLVLALTGTDVYGQIQTDPIMSASVERADRLIVLQPRAIERLAPAHRDRARVVYQSCVAPVGVARAARPPLEVCVLSHLRPVKDPLVAGRAAALLPAHAPVRITHAGAALDASLAEAARDLAGSHYRWIGEVDRARALSLVASSHLLLLTSVSEGGANVVTEAIACATPVVSTRIDGSLGLLGDDYPGYVAVGDPAGVAAMLTRAATDDEFYRSIERAVTELAAVAAPAEERARLGALLAELV